MSSDEHPLRVFICSRMNERLRPYRAAARDACASSPFTPWLFEDAPASSDSAVDAYLAKVAESDFFVFLAGSEGSTAVANEIRTALATKRRLLVFRIASAQHDDAMSEIFALVRPNVKFVDVLNPDDLQAKLDRSLRDELIRAIRFSTSGLSETALLESAQERSVHRCTAMAVAYGVHLECAEELARDTAWLPLHRTLPEQAEGELLVVQGDSGSGKTWVAERLFQEAAARRQSDPLQPWPVLVGSEFGSPHLGASVADARGLPEEHSGERFLVIVDDYDAEGRHPAARILVDARAFLTRHESSTVILLGSTQGATLETTTHALPGLTGEQLQVLVERVARRGEGAHPSPGRLDADVMAAAGNPALATLLAVQLRTLSNSSPSSTGMLLANLARGRVEEVVNDYDRVEPLLIRLAVDCLNSGDGHVRERDGNHRVGTLLASGLIRRDRGRLSFQQALLRDWFGTRALALDMVSASELSGSGNVRMRWLLPASMFFASSKFCESRSVVEYWAREDPCLFSAVIEKATASHGSSSDSLPMSSDDMEEALLAAAEAVLDGLSPYFRDAFPHRRDGSLIRPQVDTSRKKANIVWVDERGSQLRWESGTPSDDPGWPWRQAHGLAASRFGELLAEIRRLGIVREAAYESAWVAACGALRRDSASTHTLSAAEFTGVGHVGDSRAPKLAEAADGPVPCGTFRSPWPLPDRPRSSRFIDSYTPERLRDRVEAVLRAAILSSRCLADRVLPKLARRLRSVRLQANPVTAIVTPGVYGRGEVTWGFVPRVDAAEPTVRVRWLERDPAKHELERMYDRIRVAMRRDDAWWGTVAWTTSVMPLLHEDAIRDVTATILEGDLGEWGWSRH